MSSFNKYAIRTIKILSGNMQPTEAIAALQAANASHGVVIDEQGVPAALVVAEDLEQAASQGAPFLLHLLSTLPPVVIVGSQASMQDLVRDTTLKSFIAGASGAVVLDDEGIFGIVPTQTIRQFLGTGQAQVDGGTLGPSAKLGDILLDGKRTKPLCRVKCAECGFVNKLPFLDRQNLDDCQNPNVPPHTLKLN